MPSAYGGFAPTPPLGLRPWTPLGGLRPSDPLVAPHLAKDPAGAHATDVITRLSRHLSCDDCWRIAYSHAAVNISCLVWEDKCWPGDKWWKPPVGFITTVCLVTGIGFHANADIISKYDTGLPTKFVHTTAECTVVVIAISFPFCSVVDTVAGAVRKLCKETDAVVISVEWVVSLMCTRIAVNAKQHNANTGWSIEKWNMHALCRLSSRTV